MGLDTTHDAWHGPYSSFHRWRIEIAKCIGLDLNKMEGFGGRIQFDQNHKLTPLLSHSDCDGELTPAECKLISEGLTEILPLLHNYDKENAIQFIKGCESAYQKNESIEFH